MTDTRPAELRESPRGSGGGGLIVSLVWLVPLVALGVALFIGWQAISSRGPVITIDFPSAEGITAGSTVLRYREVNVGIVESVTFTEDLTAVRVHVRLDKDVAHYVDDSARFWIVRPQVTARGVSGLGTVLSGVYLEGTWDTQPGTHKAHFEGLSAPPLVRDGEEGLQITLRAREGGRLQDGAPIVYRGVTVGAMAEPQLAEDGQSVIAQGFIEAPHDKLVTDGTRFWGASGFSVNLGTGGLSVNVASLASLLEGGISFDTLTPDQPEARTDQVFEVFESEAAARDSTNAIEIGDEVPFSVLFETSVSGLTSGAAVEYQGVRVGSVTGLSVERETADGEVRLALRADIGLSPSRMGLPEDADAETTVAFIARAVEDGLRARLASQGLLSTTLKIELVQLTDATPATLVTDGDTPPSIPTAPSAVTDVAETARGVLGRIQDLPIESLLNNINTLVASVTAVVSSDEVRQAPAAIVGLIDDTRSLVSSEALQDTITQASDSVAQINLLLERVNDSEAVPAILAALQRTDAIAASLQTTTEGLPALVDRIGQVAATAAAMPLDTLANEASGVIEDARRLIGSEEIAGLPATLATSLDNLEAATANVRDLTGRLSESGAVDSLLTALQRLGDVMTSVDSAASGLPDLLSKIDSIAAEVASLPLNDLVTRADDVLASANSLLSSEDTARIPASVNAALTGLTSTIADVGAITDQITTGTAIPNLMAALDRTNSIAQSIEVTAAGLPELLNRIQAVAAEAESLPLSELVTSANDLVQSADALVSSPDTAQIPASLSSALDQLAAALAELREGGAVDNTNAALASAREAADAIAAAAQGLPELTARLDAVILTSEQAIATYGQRSEFNNQTLGALRDLRDAARAVTSLARTIERKPNSLIMGR